MRLIFHIRPLKFFFIQNWYGIRRTYYDTENYWLLDIGAITVGMARFSEIYKKLRSK
jgi:hypothetical protein